METTPSPLHPAFVLRAPRYDDVGIYTAFMADPQVTVWLEDRCQRPIHFHHALSFVLGEAWCRLAIEYQGRFVGITGLEDYDPCNGVARFFIVIGDRDASSRGLGTAVTNALVNKGFRDLGLRKIVSNYFAPNLASKVIHARAGFAEEGVQRKVGWRRGEWVDHVLVSILREDWQASAAAEPLPGKPS